jgi:hypothetical protein
VAIKSSIVPDEEIIVYAKKRPVEKPGALSLKPITSEPTNEAPVAPAPEPLDGANPFGGAFYPEPGNRLDVAAGGPFAEGLKLLAKSASVLSIEASQEALEKQAKVLQSMEHTGPLPKYAININLHNIYDPNQINSTILDVANALGAEKIEQARRGVVSFEKTAELALEEFHKNEGFMLKRTLGQAFNPHEVMATRMVVATARENTAELKNKIKAGVTDNATLIEFLSSYKMQAAVQLQLNGMAAEAGRTLGAMRRKVRAGEISHEQVRRLAEKFRPDDLMDEQALLESMGGLEGVIRAIEMDDALTTPAQKNAFALKLSQPDGWDMLREAWYGAVLSGPWTHFRNVVGNNAALGVLTAERAVAAKWGKAFGFIGKGQGVQEGEATAMLTAYWDALGDAFKLGSFALRHGEQVGSEVGYRMPLSHKEIWKLSTPQAMDLIGGGPAEIGKMATGHPPAITGKNVISLITPKKSSKRSKTEAPGAIEARGALGRMTDLFSNLVDVGGGAIRTSTRLLGVEDQFTRTLAFRAEAKAQLTREATNAGYKGQDFHDYVEQGVYFLSPKQEQAAEHFAKIATMSEALISKSTRGAHMIGQSRIGFIFAPFVRVTSNILDFSTQRVGFPLRPLWWKELYSDDLAKRDLAMAKASTGALMWLTAYSAASTMYGDDEDALIVITGKGPSDPELKKIWLQRGLKEYSIRVGGKGGKWGQYSRIDPGGQMLGIATDSINLMGLMDELTAQEFAASLIAGIGNNVLNKSYMSSSLDAMEVFRSFDPKEYSKWLQRQAAGFLVPNLVTQIVAEQDPYLRRAVTISEEITKRTSVEGRRNLPAVRDLSGKSLPLTQRWGISVADDKPDPVADELWRLEMNFSAPSQNLRGAELTEHQYDRYQQLVGYALKMPPGSEYFGVTPRGKEKMIKVDLSGKGMWEALGTLMKARGYADATDGAEPPGQKVLMIRQLRDRYIDAAQARLLGEYPSIAKKALETASKSSLAKGADPLNEQEADAVRRDALQSFINVGMSYEVVE